MTTQEESLREQAEDIVSLIYSQAWMREPKNMPFSSSDVKMQADRVVALILSREREALRFALNCLNQQNHESNDQILNRAINQIDDRLHGIPQKPMEQRADFPEDFDDRLAELTTNTSDKARGTSADPESESQKDV